MRNLEWVEEREGDGEMEGVSSLPAPSFDFLLSFLSFPVALLVYHCVLCHLQH